MDRIKLFLHASHDILSISLNLRFINLTSEQRAIRALKHSSFSSRVDLSSFEYVLLSILGELYRSAILLLKVDEGATRFYTLSPLLDVFLQRSILCFRVEAWSSRVASFRISHNELRLTFVELAKFTAALPDLGMQVQVYVIWAVFLARVNVRTSVADVCLRARILSEFEVLLAIKLPIIASTYLHGVVLKFDKAVSRRD